MSDKLSDNHTKIESFTLPLRYCVKKHWVFRVYFLARATKKGEEAVFDWSYLVYSGVSFVDPICGKVATGKASTTPGI